MQIHLANELDMHDPGDQWQQAPCQPYISFAFRILQYLKLHPSFGILILVLNKFYLSTYSNVNWASCSATHHYCNFHKLLQLS